MSEPQIDPIIQYESTTTPAARPPIAVRFWLLVLISACAGLLLWTLFDFFYVRYGYQGREGVLVLGVYVAATFFSGIHLFRHRGSNPAAGLGCLATILACFLALLLILFIGMQFHFYIGGRL